MAYNCYNGGTRKPKLIHLSYPYKYNKYMLLVSLQTIDCFFFAHDCVKSFKYIVILWKGKFLKIDQNSCDKLLIRNEYPILIACTLNSDVNKLKRELLAY